MGPLEKHCSKSRAISQRIRNVKNAVNSRCVFHEHKYYIFVLVTPLLLTVFISLFFFNVNASWNTTFTAIEICDQISTGPMDLFLPFKNKTVSICRIAFPEITRSAEKVKKVRLFFWNNLEVVNHELLQLVAGAYVTTRISFTWG